MKIIDDRPHDADPATPEERKRILDTLSKYVTSDSVLTLDAEQRRGKKDNKQELTESDKIG